MSNQPANLVIVDMKCEDCLWHECVASQCGCRCHIEMLLSAAKDLLDAVYMAIPSFQTYGEDSYDRLLALCRAYMKATGKRHPADRWTA